MIHWSLQQSWLAVTPALCHPEASLTPAERARLSQLRMPRRRCEWLMGRLTAKLVVARALAEAGPGEWPLLAIEILADASGKPVARLAPEAAPVAGFTPGRRLPVSVSISHTQGHALCAATRLPPGPAEEGGLGIDLGRIEPRSKGFVETFLTPDEQAFVWGGASDEQKVRANLVWCAKEAVLKALGLGLTVDTHSLTCLPGGDAGEDRWPLAPSGGWQPFTAACGPALLPGGGTVQGLWRALPGFVAALARHTPSQGAPVGEAFPGTLPLPRWEGLAARGGYAASS